MRRSLFFAPFISKYWYASAMHYGQSAHSNKISGTYWSLCSMKYYKNILYKHFLQLLEKMFCFDFGLIKILQVYLSNNMIGLLLLGSIPKWTLLRQIQCNFPKCKFFWLKLLFSEHKYLSRKVNPFLLLSIFLFQKKKNNFHNFQLTKGLNKRFSSSKSHKRVSTLTSLLWLVKFV